MQTFKGAVFRKNVGRVKIFFCILSDGENILDGIKVIEWTRFSYENFKGA